MKKRISKNRYYMNIAKEVASRSNCFRAHHGVVIVKDDQIVATGYSGAPRGIKDCLDRGSCLRIELAIPSGQRYELCRSVHAEQNAIINAARSGTKILDGVMYLYSLYFDKKGNESVIDALPCFICKKMIINAGIEKFISHRRDGSLKEYFVKDWVEDWKNRDLADDLEQYGLGIKKEKFSN